jgi:hypothetical protein
MGRKASEINFPFEAKKKDLPALATKEPEEDTAHTDGEQDPPPFDWKRHLSKCIRLTRKTAIQFGMIVIVVRCVNAAVLCSNMLCCVYLCVIDSLSRDCGGNRTWTR